MKKHQIELEGVVDSSTSPSLKLRDRGPWAEAVPPHHKIHYIQTAINQVIIFHSLNSVLYKIGDVLIPSNSSVESLKFFKEGVSKFPFPQVFLELFVFKL